MAPPIVPAALQLTEQPPAEIAHLLEAPPGAVWFCLELYDDAHETPRWTPAVKEEWGHAAKWHRWPEEWPWTIAERFGAGVYRVTWTQEDRRKPIVSSEAFELDGGGRWHADVFDDDDAGELPAEPEPEPEPEPRPSRQRPPPKAPPAPTRAPAVEEDIRPEGAPPRGLAPIEPGTSAAAQPQPPTGLGAWLPSSELASTPLGQFAGVVALAQPLLAVGIAAIERTTAAALENERQRSRTFEAALETLNRRPPPEDPRPQIQEMVLGAVQPLAQAIQELQRRLDDEDDEDDKEDAAAALAKAAELVNRQPEPDKMQMLLAFASSPIGQKLVEKLLSGLGEKDG